MNPNIPGHSGTTSACAENTDWGAAGTPLSGNYLRVRGEYLKLKCRCRTNSELPPRARRIPARYHNFTLCAWNYLRVRGEYPSAAKAKMIITELPPRARRIRMQNATHADLAGTTSACAENTLNELGLL